MKCPRCESDNVETYADYDRDGELISDGWYCLDCGAFYEN